MRIYNYAKSHIYFIIIFSFIILSFVSDIILMHSHVLFAIDGTQFHDIQFHIKRIMELHYLIKDHKIPVNFAFNYFHGTAVMGMYPYYILLSFVSIFYITGSYIKSYYIYFMLICLVSLNISFFSSLYFNHSKRISYIFSIVYTMSLPFILDYFYDIDLGLTSALTFFPLVFFGAIQLYNRHNKYLELSLGLFLMSLCQLPATIIAFIFVILWILININTINKSTISNIVKFIFLDFLLTSIIWVPMYIVSVNNIINTPGKISIPLQTSNMISIVKNIGICSVIILCISLIIFKKLIYIHKEFLILSIIIIFCTSDVFPIKLLTSFGIFKYINEFQFTARFLIIPNILLCYLFSSLFVQFSNHFKYTKLCIFIFLIIFIIFQLLSQIYLIHNGFTNSARNIRNYTTVRNVGSMNHPFIINRHELKYVANGYTPNKDYYPAKSVSVSKYINNNYYNYNKKDILRHIGYNKFMFDNNKHLSEMILPMVKYNKEHLHIYINNRPTKYYVNNHDLLVLHNITKGFHTLSFYPINNLKMILVEIIMFLISVCWIIYRIISYFICKFFDKHN